MMWSLHVLFQINCIVTKRRERLRASGVVSLFHLFFLMDQTHSLSTASHRGFQHDRETDLPADPACFSNILQRLLRARNDRHAGVYHPLAGGYFISHRLHRFCRRADKDDSFFFAPAGKIRILGQETISGMNRIHLVLLGCSDDLFDIQVTIF